MTAQGREAAEAAIGRVLLEQWNPAAAHAEATAASDAASNTAEHTAAQAHEIYNLLARGASDAQVERHLRHVAQDELHQPELAARDLDTVLRALRQLERTVI